MKPTSPFTRRVLGLVFWPERKPELPLYPGIENWKAKGCPEPALVYDHAGALVDRGIPVVDAVYSAGAWVRVPNYSLPDPVPSVTIKSVHTKLGPVQVFSPEGGAEFSGVVLVTPEAYKKSTGHNKMSRGHNKRKAKK